MRTKFSVLVVFLVVFVSAEAISQEDAGNQQRPRTVVAQVSQEQIESGVNQVFEEIDLPAPAREDFPIFPNLAFELGGGYLNESDMFNVGLTVKAEVFFRISQGGFGVQLGAGVGMTRAKDLEGENELGLMNVVELGIGYRSPYCLERYLFIAGVEWTYNLDMYTFAMRYPIGVRGEWNIIEKTLNFMVSVKGGYDEADFRRTGDWFVEGSIGLVWLF